MGTANKKINIKVTYIDKFDNFCFTNFDCRLRVVIIQGSTKMQCHHNHERTLTDRSATPYTATMTHLKRLSS